MYTVDVNITKYSLFYVPLKHIIYDNTHRLDIWMGHCKQ